MDLQRKTDTNTILMGDLNMLLTSLERPIRQKLSKETMKLTQTIEQMDLIVIYKSFHSMYTEYTFFFISTWNLV